MRVPKVALARVPAPVVAVTPPPLVTVTAGGWLKAPSTFGQLLVYLLAAWGTITFLLLILSLFTFYTKYIAMALFLVVTGATLQEMWKLLRSRQLVLIRKDVPILWGFVRLIAWDPVEGVLILQNKNVGFSDDDLQDGRGGVRFIYPILGEELALRVPLEVQTLRFRDENVMTREYLSVTIKGTMKWRIVDIKKFYLLVSRELRETDDHNERVKITPTTRPLSSGDENAESMIGQLLRAAIEWMRILAEEQTRIVVSHASSGLLIADQLSQDFTPQSSGKPRTEAAPDASKQGARGEWGGAADGLAAAIHDTIANRLEGFGIAVDDVSLQEIKLPQEVIDECINACKAYYYPVRAQRQASFKGAEMQAQADVMGREAFATREIVGAAPAFGVADFLSKFLNERLAPAGNVSAIAAVTTIAAASAVLPTKALPSNETIASN